MQNNVLGVNDGLSKMPHATMCFPVGLITRINSILGKDVEERGVGHVGKSIAVSIQILSLVSDAKMQKIIIIPFAVRRRKDSNRKSIAAEDIARTVPNGGRKN